MTDFTLPDLFILGSYRAFTLQFPEATDDTQSIDIQYQYSFDDSIFSEWTDLISLKTPIFTYVHSDLGLEDEVLKTGLEAPPYQFEDPILLQIVTGDPLQPKTYVSQVLPDLTFNSVSSFNNFTQTFPQRVGTIDFPYGYPNPFGNAAGFQWPYALDTQVKHSGTSSLRIGGAFGESVEAYQFNSSVFLACLGGIGNINWLPENYLYTSSANIQGQVLQAGQQYILTCYVKAQRASGKSNAPSYTKFYISIAGTYSNGSRFGLSQQYKLDYTDPLDSNTWTRIDLKFTPFLALTLNPTATWWGNIEGIILFSLYDWQGDPFEDNTLGVWIDDITLSKTTVVTPPKGSGISSTFVPGTSGTAGPSAPLYYSYRYRIHTQDGAVTDWSNPTFAGQVQTVTAPEITPSTVVATHISDDAVEPSALSEDGYQTFSDPGPLPLSKFYYAPEGNITFTFHGTSTSIAGGNISLDLYFDGKYVVSSTAFTDAAGTRLTTVTAAKTINFTSFNISSNPHLIEIRAGTNTTADVNDRFSLICTPGGANATPVA